jgi:hypothetical protein
MLVGIITIIIATIVVFNHQLVWLLAVFPGLYIAYAFFIAYSQAPKLKQGLHLTDAESQAWKEHHAFFRFPFAARKMAGSLSALQFISVILAIALIVTGAYWGAVFLLGWLLGLPTPRLNPEASIAPAAQKGNPDAIVRLNALETLQAKLKAPDKHSKPQATPKHSEATHTQPDKKSGKLSKQSLEELNSIKQRIEKAGNQPVIALLAKVPSITRRLLKLRGVDVPESKDSFMGVVSFTGRNVAFTLLDYKMNEDMHQTVMLANIEDIRDVWIGDKRTVLSIKLKDGEEVGLITMNDDIHFTELAKSIKNNSPHLYAK